MKTFHKVMTLGSVLACFCLIAGGCGSKSKSDKNGSKTASAKTGDKSAEGDSLTGKSQSEPEVPIRKPIVDVPPPDGTNGGTSGKSRGPGKYASVRDALKPLQILVGEWNGITTKKIKDFDGREAPVWSWDFSRKDQPALAFSMEECSFFRNGRLTYLLDSQEFELTAEDRKGKTRVYRGNFTEPVRDAAGEGKALQRKFKLTLTQVKPALGTRDLLARVEFNQMENNRYLLLVHRKAGPNIRLAETVGNQRKGTSFAASLDDYGDRTCVVTQGLGTMTVSYKGKTYYVCCSGCKKTFEDDPAQWVASFEKWKRENGKK